MIIPIPTEPSRAATVPSWDPAEVAVRRTGLSGYPTTMPFHPPQRYPELPGLDVDPDNRLYAEVRQTLIQLGLDRDHVGTQRWNPLRDIVKPGMTVLIKPNTVSHKHWVTATSSR